MRTKRGGYEENYDTYDDVTRLEFEVLSREGLDMQRIQTREEGHSRGSDGRLVGTRKEIGCVRYTHKLRTAEGGRDSSGHCQDRKESN